MTDNRTTDRVDHSPRVRDAIDELMRKKDAADNRTTERLMAMLEERGVKYELEHDLYVEWVDARGNEVTAFETSCKHRGDVLIVHVFLTPEQAIAATLGSELNPDGLPMGLTISDDGNMLNWRGENYVKQGTLGNGTLTAEQVKRIHEIIEKHWHDLPDEYDMPEATALPEYSYDWQAIADELNAELGSDDEYEAKMDALLCRLTNGKWSKSRAYDLDFMESCVNEEFEALYSEEQFSAPVHGTLTAEQVREVIYKHGVNDGSVYSVFKGSFKAIADELNAKLGSKINGETSDGYHTFNELYHHRAVLFSVIVRDHRGLAWKARKHHDGTMYEGMFIVGIETPKGQATYHYDLDPYWEMFDCEEREFAPEWDGHTPDDAIARIAELGSECDKWKAKAEEAGRAMNAAAGLWAKADAENRELRKMLLLDDGTVEEYTERADPLTALAYQKQLAEGWRDRCHNAEALCDKLEAERDELKAFSERLEMAAHDKLGVTLFGVDYVTEEFLIYVQDTLKAERDEWKTKCETREFAYKQADAERKRYSEQIYELLAERDEWKANLADMNAELGSGTCENASELNTDGLAGYYFTCSECGLSICASMGIGEIELSGPRSFGWKVNGRYEFERCPRCGKAVKR